MIIYRLLEASPYGRSFGGTKSVEVGGSGVGSGACFSLANLVLTGSDPLLHSQGAIRLHLVACLSAAYVSFW